MTRRRYTRGIFTLILGLISLHAFGATWYVSKSGGTRQQCDGKADAPYPGKGGNQHCALNDVRLLWQDGNYTVGDKFPGWGWVISGGDTVIIRGSISSGMAWRIGWSTNASCIDAKVTGGPQARGICGSNIASGMPPPPSGTASQHTRILGENYASCHAQSARTQLHGGFGVGTVLALNGSSYVDVACLDITDFSACGRVGQSKACNVNPGNLDDFATNGLSFSNTSTQITLTDVRVHGLGSVGIVGPTGANVMLNYVDIVGNAGSGWNADAGDGTTGVGSLTVSHYSITGNGCAEEYPIVDAMPYADCTDDGSGGYGDGFGTATVPSPAPGWQVSFDQGTVSYNTQDGLDALHISGPGSSMSVTHTLAFGNMGQQIKVGGSAPILTNNTIVGNCRAMKESIPEFPTGFNIKLSDFCRAGDAAVLINVPPTTPAVYRSNTMLSNNHVGLEVQYPGPVSGTETILFENNVFVGFVNSSGELPSPIYGDTDLKMFTNAGSSFTRNITYHARSDWKCPATSLHETQGRCGDPHLKDETWHPYGYGNMERSSGQQTEMIDPAPVDTGGRPHTSVAVKLAGGLALTLVSWMGWRYFRSHDPNV